MWRMALITFILLSESLQAQTSLVAGETQLTAVATEQDRLDFVYQIDGFGCYISSLEVRQYALRKTGFFGRPQYSAAITVAEDLFPDCHILEPTTKRASFSLLAGPKLPALPRGSHAVEVNDVHFGTVETNDEGTIFLPQAGIDRQRLITVTSVSRPSPFHPLTLTVESQRRENFCNAPLEFEWARVSPWQNSKALILQTTGFTLGEPADCTDTVAAAEVNISLPETLRYGGTVALIIDGQHLGDLSLDGRRAVLSPK